MPSSTSTEYLQYFFLPYWLSACLSLVDSDPSLEACLAGYLSTPQMPIRPSNNTNTEIAISTDVATDISTTAANITGRSVVSNKQRGPLNESTISTRTTSSGVHSLSESAQHTQSISQQASDDNCGNHSSSVATAGPICEDGRRPLPRLSTTSTSASSECSPAKGHQLGLNSSPICRPTPQGATTTRTTTTSDDISTEYSPSEDDCCEADEDNDDDLTIEAEPINSTLSSTAMTNIEGRIVGVRGPHSDVAMLDGDVDSSSMISLESISDDGEVYEDADTTVGSTVDEGDDINRENVKDDRGSKKEVDVLKERPDSFRPSAKACDITSPPGALHTSPAPPNKQHAPTCSIAPGPAKGFVPTPASTSSTIGPRRQMWQSKLGRLLGGLWRAGAVVPKRSSSSTALVRFIQPHSLSHCRLQPLCSALSAVGHGKLGAGRQAPLEDALLVAANAAGQSVSPPPLKQKTTLNERPQPHCHAIPRVRVSLSTTTTTSSSSTTAVSSVTSRGSAAHNGRGCDRVVGGDSWEGVKSEQARVLSAGIRTILGCMDGGVLGGTVPPKRSTVCGINTDILLANISKLQQGGSANTQYQTAAGFSAAPNRNVIESYCSYFHSEYKCFDSVFSPGISVHDYISRLMSLSGCTVSAFILSIALIQRLIKTTNGRMKLTSLNIHRLLLTAVVVASKYFEDSVLSIHHYSAVGGASWWEIVKHEENLTNLLGFRLGISTEEYRGVSTAILMMADILETLRNRSRSTATAAQRSMVSASPSAQECPECLAEAAQVKRYLIQLLLNVRADTIEAKKKQKSILPLTIVVAAPSRYTATVPAISSATGTAIRPLDYNPRRPRGLSSTGYQSPVPSNACAITQSRITEWPESNLTTALRSRRK